MLDDENGISATFEPHYEKQVDIAEILEEEVGIGATEEVVETAMEIEID